MYMDYAIDTHGTTMTDLDLKTLRALGGQDVPDFQWGAVVSVCMEFLVGHGFAERGYKITSKGVDFLVWSESNNWSTDIELFEKERR